MKTQEQVVGQIIGEVDPTLLQCQNCHEFFPVNEITTITGPASYSYATFVAEQGIHRICKKCHILFSRIFDDGFRKGEDVTQKRMDPTYRKYKEFEDIKKYIQLKDSEEKIINKYYNVPKYIIKDDDLLRIKLDPVLFGNFRNSENKKKDILTEFSIHEEVPLSRSEYLGNYWSNISKPHKSPYTIP